MSSRHPLLRLPTLAAGGALVLVAGALLVPSSRTPIDATIASETVTEIDIAGRADAGGDVAAVSLNLTAVAAIDNGYAAAYPCGGDVPATSTLNYRVGETIANSAVVEVGGNGKVCVFNRGATDLVVDVGGYLTEAAYRSAGPERLLDTRLEGGARQAGSITEVQVAGRAGIPDDAAAVSINLTAAGAFDPGHLTAFPCGGALPPSSTLNYRAGDVVANSTLVGLGDDGKICVFTHAATNILVDASGYLTASGYDSVGPARLLDTRVNGGKRATGTTTEIQVTGRAGIPDSATAASINLTAAGALERGHVLIYPCADGRSGLSTLNFNPGHPIANSTLVELDAAGKVCVYNFGATDIVVDVGGYLTGDAFKAATPERLLDSRVRATSPSANPPISQVGAQYVETFDDPTAGSRLVRGVYHRNIGASDTIHGQTLWGGNNAIHGGTWPGDHDLSCGAPTTQRQLRSTMQQGGADNGWEPIVDFNLDEIQYTCKNHWMTSMGGTDAYSVTWFAPNQTFNNVRQVCVDVNLTDLGTRQWIKFGVVSDSLWNQMSTSWVGSGMFPSFIVSDVGASNLPDRLSGPDRLIVSYGGGASAGYPGGLKIGDGGGAYTVGGGFDAGSDKATRYPLCITEDADGTGVTFTVYAPDGNARIITQRYHPGVSLPDGPSHVVFYDHDYTPDKSESGPPIGFTHHWDNIVVK